MKVEASILNEGAEILVEKIREFLWQSHFFAPIILKNSARRTAFSNEKSTCKSLSSGLVIALITGRPNADFE